MEKEEERQTDGQKQRKTEKDFVPYIRDMSVTAHLSVVLLHRRVSKETPG